MIKTLFLIAALLVPGLAYAANPSAPFSVQVVAPPSGITCDIGPPYTGAIPAAAIQAGFTHCAANYDFTYTGTWTSTIAGNTYTYQWSNMSGSGGISGWFSCVSGARPPALFSREGSNTVPCDATHVFMTTDSGAQVLAMAFLKSDNDAGLYWNRYDTDGDPSYPAFNMAEQYYIEFVVRPSTMNMCSNYCQETSLSADTKVLGNPCYYGTDMEFDSGATSTGVGEFENNPICGSSGIQNLGATPIGGALDTQLRTWGNLTTGDGISQSASCNYSALGAVPGLPAGAFHSCAQFTLIPPSNSTAVFSQAQPMYVRINSGTEASGPGANIQVSSFTQYIQRFTVWECAGYASGGCINNPVITTAP
jgi:hypothetical protein